ncbi:MAG: acyl-CoA synthetase (AMP-forming)/AMP-acid ligase II [Myxococcota bacterium]|jgi:acyl-CoA synthetase (AMP-forming)/AMP-acid ligase II
MTAHVLAPLFAHARTMPDTPLLTWVDHRGRDAEQWTAHQVLARCAAVAAGLRERDVEPGQRALLVYRPGLEFVAAFGGCLLAGVLPVPVYPPQPGSDVDQRRLEALARASGTRIALTSRRFRWLQTASAGWLRLRGSQGARDLVWWSTDGARPVPIPVDPPHAAPEDPAFLQFTSGSTAAPKGVVLTHGNLGHQLRMNREHLGLDASARVVAWVPQYHDLGLVSGILSCLSRGGPLWLIAPTTFLRDPGIWLDVAHRVRATHTAAPNFAWDLLVRRTTPARRAAWDLSCVKVFMSAAEPVVPASVERLRNALAPSRLDPAACCPAYGLAEHTVGVTWWGRGSVRVGRRELEVSRSVVVRPDGDLELAACGAPAPDVAVRIVHDGRSLGEDELGEIWVDSDSRSPGYWQRPDLTERGLGALHGEPGRRWLRTGDLGFLHGGQLYVAGRIKDIVLVRGRNIAAEEIEECLRDLDPQVRPGGIAAFALPSAEGERVGLVVEVVDGTQGLDALAQRVLARCQATWAVPTTVVLAPPRSVRKTTSGKVRRRSTMAALEAGEITVLHRCSGGDPPRRTQVRPEVVVIGGGLAGLITADALQRSGHQVTLLEAAESVGGQVRTLPAGELGAMGFGRRWRELRRVVDDLGLPIRQRLYSVGALRNGQVERENLADALRWVERALAAGNATEALPWDALDGIGAASWAADHGLAPFPSAFQSTWAFHGYGGETDSVSAASLLAYARLLDPNPRLWQLGRGNAHLPRALADRLRSNGGTVRTRSPVQAIEAGTVHLADDTLSADLVVSALPPAALAPLLPTDDPRMPLLRRFVTHDYRTSVVTLGGMPRRPRCVTVPASFDGRSRTPVGLFRGSQAADDWTVYQLAAPLGGTPLDDAALDAEQDALFAVLGGTLHARHGSARWAHFPHLPPQAAGTRAALDALQGHDGVWLAGAWWGAGTAEDAAVSAGALVDRILGS